MTGLLAGRAARGGLAIAIGAVVTLGPGVAAAYNCLTTSCAGYCQSPAPYRLGRPSDDLGVDVSEAEVKRAMEAWAQRPCTSLKTQYGGRTEEVPRGSNSVVALVEQGWTYGSGSIGVTSTRGGRGCITSHMVTFRWVTGVPKRGEVNAFSIVGHEGGHYFGLGHSSAAGAIMRATYSGGVIALSGDDEAGICKIYPRGGGGAAPATSCAETGCPAGATCVAGVCRRDGADGGAQEAPRMGADAAVQGPVSRPNVDAAPRPATTTPLPPVVVRADGERCATGDECRSNLCLEIEGRSVCSRICTDAEDCVSGFGCQRVGDERVCLPLAKERRRDAGAGDATGAGAGGTAPEIEKVGGGGCAVGGRNMEDGARFRIAMALAGAIAAVAHRRRAARRRSDRS